MPVSDSDEPLASLYLPGMHAYAEKCVAAGEMIQFRVSSDGPYRLSIARLGWDVSSPAQDRVIHRFPESPGAVQPIRPGSYVHVADALPSAAFAALSLECWVRPWLHKWQGLISQYTYSTACGCGLFLDPEGRPAFYFGDGGAFRAGWLATAAAPIPLREWIHIVAVFDHGIGTLWVNGEMHATVSGPDAANPGPAPLRLAAYGASGLTGYCLDGDLAMPAIYGRALTTAEIRTRAAWMPPAPPPGPGLLGCWPMTEEQGQRLADTSVWARTGQIVNRATWMIGGPGFDAAAVDRFGAYDPSADPARGHGLRFSSEDLFDCGWNVTEGYAIPADVPSGVYVGRIHYGPDFARRYDVTFVVKPGASKPKARLLVLCATNTWLAYNVPFPVDPEAVDWGTGGHGASLANAPGFSMYDNYRDSGAPSYQMGVRMPWSAYPYMTYGLPDYGHLLRAERPLHVWLEQNGYDYDVASDLDLHQQGMLDEYVVVVINGHSEYWSVQGYDALDHYLSAGGRVIVLSGNTMFWRVSFDDAGEIMECRKLPARVGGRSDDLVGELYHAHDGARGGLMRECGYPAWRLIGLESVGYDGSAGTYVVQAPEHPFFLGPEAINVEKGQPLGSGVVHHEYDVRLSQIPGPFSPPPLPGPQPQALAQAFTDPSVYGAYFDYRANHTAAGGVRSEIIDWERGSGGRVFGIGAIAAGRGLATDPRLGALLRNVLHYFGVTPRTSPQEQGS